MKPKANINLPQWAIAVGIVAVIESISIVFNWFDFGFNVEWVSYVSLVGVSLETVIWGFIIYALYKAQNISSFLLIMLIISRVLFFIDDGFLDEDLIRSYIFWGIWLVALIGIIVSYSGAFRGFAITEIICGGVFYALVFVLIHYDFGLDLDLKSNRSPILETLICVFFIYLIYYPYHALADALRENGEEDEIVIVDEDSTSSD
ncbi:MAG: hypothetical protein IK008_05900 [Bacteroidales bacterium]|nr:hypothetical protein [Bacteroidales bacterium]